MKWFVALAIALVPTEALAATWKEVARSTDSLTIIWVDKDSIKHGKNSSFAWWRMKMSDGDFSTTLSAFNCNAKGVMDLQMVIYKTNGETMNLNSRLKGEWSFASPDSLLEGLADAVCGERW